MATRLIPATTALSRHAEEAAELMQKLGVADPEQASWAYSMAQRIGGEHRARVDKGVNLFLNNPDPYYIGLQASAGKKRQEIALDKDKLVAGPRANLPRELFEPVRPEGVSAFFWKPNNTQSPGWNEMILTAGVRQGESMLLLGTCDDGASEIIHATPGKWKEVQHGAAEVVFGKKLAPKVRAWLRKGTPPAEDTGIKTMSLAEIEGVVVALPHRKLPAAPSTVQEILAALGHHHVPPGAAAPAPVLPIEGGRVFAWGDQVDDADIADYTRLVSSQVGPSSGNAMAVLMGATNPVNIATKEISRAILNQLAQGATREQALHTAMNDHATANQFPVFEGGDPLQYLSTHWQGASAAPARLVSLNTRRLG